MCPTLAGSSEVVSLDINATGKFLISGWLMKTGGGSAKEGRKRTGHSMRGGGRPAQALWAEWQDTTSEEGGEPGRRFLMGQKLPGVCPYDLCTGDRHKTHGERALPPMCTYRCTHRSALIQNTVKQCRQSSGGISRSSNEGTIKWLLGGVGAHLREMRRNQGREQRGKNSSLKKIFLRFQPAAVSHPGPR